jgi:phosphopantothenate-cysteine ligase
MKQIIVTSGGTVEYIDDVQVLTNTSSGLLGYKIATELARIKGYMVHYVHSKTAVIPNFSDPYMKCYEVRTAQDTFDTLKKIIEENKIDAVVHSMAVSDFTFKREGAIRLKSSDPKAFIKYMRKTITTNPKIISYIKTWCPDIILVGFKFEVGLNFEQIKKAAEKSIKINGCDLVIANDKEETIRAKEHVAHFFFSERIKTRYGIINGTVPGKDEIALKLRAFLYRMLLLS